MENTISFTYNPYIYFESYKNVIQNIRKWYPNSDIFIYMDSFRDDLDKYREISDEYNCKYIVRDKTMYFIDRKDSIDVNTPKMLEWLDRIENSCISTNSKWIMLVEDDVLIKRKIINWPNSDVGHSRNYFRPGGGSIFKKESFLDSIKKVDTLSILKKFSHANWAGDVLLEHIFKNNNITHEKWIELAEPNWHDKTDHAVFHGYKELHKLG